MADLLTRTATKVRLPDDTIHTLRADSFELPLGRMYWTRCGVLLLREHGAMLTTRDPNCAPCDSRARFGAATIQDAT